MSAPTKCDQCGAKGTYAIQVPCVMKCGGMMYFDHDAAVPEQGLREALERIANYEYYINDAAGVPVMMKKIARAALERPRPAPEPHLEREGNHIRAVGFGSGPLAPDFIPSHESKAGAALPAAHVCYVRDGDTLFLGKGLIAKIVGENK